MKDRMQDCCPGARHTYDKNRLFDGLLFNPWVPGHFLFDLISSVQDAFKEPLHSQGTKRIRAPLLVDGVYQYMQAFLSSRNASRKSGFLFCL